MATMNPQAPGNAPQQQQMQIQAPVSPRARRWWNDRELFSFGFVRSNYVTALTDWFLGLAGKSARLVLILTTLYMSAELYPGVSMPTPLNIAVFLIQLVALDVGGIGLGTLAKQARRDQNVDGARQAETLSRWMIGIMIAGIVTVGVEQTVNAIIGAGNPNTDLTTGIAVARGIVELTLIIARSFCAVLYGKVMHAVQGDAPDTSLPPTPILMDRIAELNTAIQTTELSVERRFAEMERAFKLALRATITEMAGELKAFQSDEMGRVNEALQMNFQRIEMGLTERFAPIDQSLSAMPDFGEIEQSMITVSRSVTEIRQQLTSQFSSGASAPQRQLPRPASASTVSSNAAQAGLQGQRGVIETKQAASNFDRRAFVEQCVRENADLSVSQIQQRAAALGETISVGSISAYRRDFFEKQNIVDKPSYSMVVESQEIE